MSALLSELTKASHHAACLLRPVLKADSRWLCLHRGFCPAAKEHVTDACMQIPKGSRSASFPEHPRRARPTGGLHAGTFELLQITDLLSLAQKERGKALPQDTEGP